MAPTAISPSPDPGVDGVQGNKGKSTENNEDVANQYQEGGEVLDHPRFLDVPRKAVGQQLDHPYREHEEVRVIVPKACQIALIYCKEFGCYNLPGGSVKAQDHGSHYSTALREVMEKTGCVIDVETKCMAIAEEWSNNLHQMSFCYFARLERDTGETKLMDEEIGDGLEYIWVPVKEAIERMNSANPTSEMGLSIKERGLFFVEIYQRIIDEGHAETIAASASATVDGDETEDEF